MTKKRPVRKVYRKKTHSKILVVILMVCIVGFMSVGFYFKFEKNNMRNQTLDNDTENSVEEIFTQIENDESYAISTSSKAAAEAGKQILESGGNAVDAAIAISYALGVVEPYGSGIGGGGCMVLYDPSNDEYHFYNYGSEAAKSGGSELILVPGMVDGLECVRADFGTMELSELLQPAIKYCDGYKINKDLANRIRRATGVLGTDSVFYKNGKWLEEGDTVVQPELKKTMQKIARDGVEVVYKGEIAKHIAEKTGISIEDMASYETIHAQPVIGTYGEYEIASASMQYSGTTLIQMVKLSEKMGMSEMNPEDESFLDALQKITLISHADRSKTVYDLRFGEEGIDQNDFVTDEYISKISGSNVENFEFENESEDTTSFTIVDKNGMIVSCTHTLSHFFGSRVVVDGIYLNNTGINFGQGVNSYAPGKRPRSHIAPTILRSKNKNFAIATPGGHAIVKVLGLLLIDICEYGTDEQEAVDKQRLFFENDNLLYYEIGYGTELFTQVTGKGYATIPVNDNSYFGNITISGYDENGRFAVRDDRREGCGIVED